MLTKKSLLGCMRVNKRDRENEWAVLKRIKFRFKITKTCLNAQQIHVLSPIMWMCTHLTMIMKKQLHLPRIHTHPLHIRHALSAMMEIILQPDHLQVCKLFWVYFEENCHEPANIPVNGYTKNNIETRISFFPLALLFAPREDKHFQKLSNISLRIFAYFRPLICFKQILL